MNYGYVDHAKNNGIQVVHIARNGRRAYCGAWLILYREQPPLVHICAKCEKFNKKSPPN